MFFPAGGIPQLQSDWSLSRDRGLDYATTTTTTTTNKFPGYLFCVWNNFSDIKQQAVETFGFIWTELLHIFF